MQPDETPKPDYNFILQDKPPTKKSLLPGAPKAVVYGGGAVIVILFLILILGLIFGKKNTGAASLLEAVGRGQEISRVTDEQSQKLKDPDTVALAATAQASVTSEQSELTSYLAKRKVKVDPKKLAIYKDPTIDTQLQQAAQNNNLDSAYSTYLQNALAQYAATLSSAFKATSSPTAKAILIESFNSTQTLRSAWGTKS